MGLLREGGIKRRAKPGAWLLDGLLAKEGIITPIEHVKMLADSKGIADKLPDMDARSAVRLILRDGNRAKLP